MGATLDGPWHEPLLWYADGPAASRDWPDLRAAGRRVGLLPVLVAGGLRDQWPEGWGLCPDDTSYPGDHDADEVLAVLLRARLDGTHPLLVAERLIGQPGVRAYVLHRVLIGVADPAQPLWHYAVDPRSHSWLRRAQEVADDPRLTEAARAIGLKTAREHYAFRYPDQVRPALTDGQLAAAHAWAEARADRTTED